LVLFKVKYLKLCRKWRAEGVDGWMERSQSHILIGHKRSLNIVEKVGFERANHTLCIILRGKKRWLALKLACEVGKRNKCRLNNIN
jgi:hypothetical protein